MSGKITKQELNSTLAAEIDDKVGSTKLEAELNKKANSSHTHSISNITGLQAEINDLKSSVSSGKNTIAAAITDKEVPASGSDSFSVLANKIRNIATGYEVGDIIAPGGVEVIEGELENFLQHFDTGDLGINFYDVKADSGGNVVIAVSGGIRKYSGVGEELWRLTDSTKYRPTESIEVASNGDIYVGGADRFVRKLNSNGNEILGKQFIGRMAEIAFDGRNEFYTAMSPGYRDSSHVLKLDANLNQLWAKLVNPSNPNMYLDFFSSDDAGNLYFYGWHNSSHRIYKFNRISKTEEWSRYLPSSLDYMTVIGNDLFFQVNGVLTKVSSSGTTIWNSHAVGTRITSLVKDKKNNLICFTYGIYIHYLNPQGELIATFKNQIINTTTARVDGSGGIFIVISPAANDDNIQLRKIRPTYKTEGYKVVR